MEQVPLVKARFDYPDLGIGVGLRTVHYGYILEDKPEVAWFEILSDNYLHTRGRPLWFLDQISERYPVALHGVGLSIGSTDPLNREYLAGLKALKRRCGAHWLSDHLCWTGVHGRYGHDLYPVPYTEESLKYLIQRVRQVQDFLGEPLLLENPSTYLGFSASTLRESEFIAALAREADCALLLDVNNLYVNAFNHGIDPVAYLQELPLERVVQFHVAGHTPCEGYLLDTHNHSVLPEVWQLLAKAFELGARASILLEWDADIPSFPELLAEAHQAEQLVSRVQGLEKAS
jgi:uncharacterized protein